MQVATTTTTTTTTKILTSSFLTRPEIGYIEQAMVDTHFFVILRDNHIRDKECNPKKAMNSLAMVFISMFNNQEGKDVVWMQIIFLQKRLMRIMVEFLENKLLEEVYLYSVKYLYTRPSLKSQRETLN